MLIRLGRRLGLRNAAPIHFFVTFNPLGASVDIVQGRRNVANRPLTKKNIMKKLAIYLTAGLLVVGAQSLMAEDATTNSPATPGQHAPHKDRGAILKLLGLTPADLKGLSKEERQAKIKSTAETVVAELQAKQTAGTLDAEGQERLTKIQKFLAHAKKQAAAQ